ncbi:MAG: hypothetical protein PVG60_08850 [Desulfarculaceae bacterium]|jgi:hypothetical protein
MAIFPDTLDPSRLSDQKGVEAWRRTITIGEGSIVLLGAYHNVDHPELGRTLEASVTVTSFCCPRGVPVSSVVIWNQFGEDAARELSEMEGSLRVQG